ncbi:hypothetical protein NBG4_320015 [Candidatus Sulfobium mesophilum]|uniref:Uncharacterized protein n=1 Tax=Candidatus Sulfobium mesophilum TaxID=2016548 RepID=A0A2U3QH97_9BACT|nr:hypothetical protein NBG4_320015 [Candidatus Sulfobium mesophilum]
MLQRRIALFHIGRSDFFLHRNRHISYRGMRFSLIYCRAPVMYHMKNVLIAPSTYAKQS